MYVDKKMLEKCCTSRGYGHSGYIVFYESGGEKVWNHLSSMKRLIRFCKNLKKRDKKFWIFSCNVKRRIKKRKREKIDEVIERKLS